MMATLRRGTTADLPAVMQLVAEYCAADGHRFDAGRVEAGVRPLLADDAVGTLWVVETDGAIDGYAAVTWGWSIEIGGRDVVLDELYVRHRNRGHGSRLLQAVEADCRARGALRIFLETERPNEAARRLYRRHGYVADDSVWMAKELR